jgi:hypothetical protein
MTNSVRRSLERFGVLIASALLAGCGTDFSKFEALTIKRAGSFELDMKPDDAFPLFTAPGEKLWISMWEPFILNGDGYEEGTVWVTAGHGHKTYWNVADYDTDAGHARYVRVTPEANSGTVDVSVTSNGNGGSTVIVTYQLTGLSDAGNENIAKLLGEAEFARMMQDWRRMINENREKIDDHFSR